MKTVFQNVWVVTENAARDVLQNGTVVVDGDRIAYVGAGLDALPAGARVVDGRGKKLLRPGLVNGHPHLPMVLFRGGADDILRVVSTMRAQFGGHVTKINEIATH